MAAPPPRRAWAPLAACLAVLALALGLRLAWFHVADRSPDEQLYAQFGAGIAHEGLAWFPRVVAIFDDTQDFEYPWVHRAGFLSLVALAQLATGRHDPVAGEVLSTACSVATVALAGALAWSLLSPWVAAISMLFLAVSPLDLALARRAWQDDVVALAVLVMAALLFRALARPAERRWRVAFFVASGLSLLIKESVAIPFALGGIALARDEWRRSRQAARALAPLAWGVIVTALVLAAIVALCGGVTRARELLALTPEAWKPDAYLLEYQTGGVGYYLTGLRILQPVPWLLGCIAALPAMFGAPFLAGPWRAGSGGRVLRLLGVYVAVFLVVSCVYSSKNMRFLSPIYAAISMLAAALVVASLGWLRRRAPARAWWAAVAATAVLLAYSAWADAKRFDHYFNEFQIQDLATPWFTKADAGLL